MPERTLFDEPLPDICTDEKSHEVRLCAYCGTELQRREVEGLRDFKRRSCCNRSCAGKSTPGKPVHHSLRFWKFVDQSGECWNWTGYVDPHGYGRFCVDRKADKAHRVAYLLLVGEIPEGMWILHHCDNRKCVNPSHLFIGDNQTNHQDMVAKSRHVFGENSSLHKLSLDSVKTIVRRYCNGEALQRELAEEYGISQNHVSGLVNGKFWKEYYDEIFLSEDICQNRHHGDAESAAAFQLVSPTIRQAHRDILAWLEVRKEGTCKEYALAVGKPLHAVSARFSEMRHKLRLIEPTGAKRDGAKAYRRIVGGREEV